MKWIPEGFSFFIKFSILGYFDYIQLHGSETNERVGEIRSMGLKTIKAIKIKDKTDIENYKKYESYFRQFVWIQKEILFWRSKESICQLYLNWLTGSL